MASGACKVSVYLWSVIRTFLCFSGELTDHSQAFCHVKAPVHLFFFTGSARCFEWKDARRETCHSDRWQPHLHLRPGTSTVKSMSGAIHLQPFVRSVRHDGAFEQPTQSCFTSESIGVYTCSCEGHKNVRMHMSTVGAEQSVRFKGV